MTIRGLQISVAMGLDYYRGMDFSSLLTLKDQVQRRINNLENFNLLHESDREEIDRRLSLHREYLDLMSDYLDEEVI